MCPCTCICKHHTYMHMYYITLDWRRAARAKPLCFTRDWGQNWRPQSPLASLGRKVSHVLYVHLSVVHTKFPVFVWCVLTQPPHKKWHVYIVQLLWLPLIESYLVSQHQSDVECAMHAVLWNANRTISKPVKCTYFVTTVRWSAPGMYIRI